MSSQVQMGPKTGLARWSWQVGRIAGIDTQIHASFLLILLWVAWQTWRSTPTAGGVALALAFTITMFACVLLHELGHALMARRFGIGTRSITLLPIGGVAQLEGMPKSARQELLVAVAGPAVNVVIAAALFGVLTIFGGLAAPQILAGGIAGGVFEFLGALMIVNVMLAVFNMLPAFPMDGGRVLRAALAMRRGRLQATEIAVKVGKVLAVALGAWGLFFTNNPFLALIAVFVWMTGQRELAMVRREAELERMREQIVLDPNTLAQLRQWMAMGRGVVIEMPDGRRVML